MELRKATSADAAAICDVVRRSISELCVADHRNDPEILAAWLANKTPENVARWLANPSNANLVACEGGAVLAAGCVTLTGEVTLNYVSPDARFRGISRAMIAALETVARDNGAGVCTLDSTLTARQFYQSVGYVEGSQPTSKHRMTTYPMSKPL